MLTQTTPSVAILLDCENVPPSSVVTAVEVAESLGRVNVRRAYGAASVLAGDFWQKALLGHAFSLSAQAPHAKKKNTSDIALSVDAMELHCEQMADIFVVATSDSDFAPLFKKLRERGARVFLLGLENTPDPVRRSCDSFTMLQTSATKEAAVVAPLSPGGPDTLPQAVKSYERQGSVVLNLLDSILSECHQSGKPAVHLAELGAILKRQEPGFDPKNLGFRNLLSFVKSRGNIEVFDLGNNQKKCRLI